MNINDKYRIETSQLGKGSFSEVFMGSNILTGQIVAIKRVSLIQKQILDKLVIEIEIMQKMDHPNIVKYYDVVKKSDYWYIVMEYCDAGTLADVVEYNDEHDKKHISFDREENTLYYMEQLKDALQYIRSSGYIHRDIKPMNVLLTKIKNDSSRCETLDLLFGSGSDFSEKKIRDWDASNKFIVKVADFGLSRHYDGNKNDMINTICGSPLYMAPELLITMEYNSSVDLWAYGVVLYEMLFGKYPLVAATIPQMKIQLRQKNIDFHLNRNFSVDCFDILVRLLDKNHVSRISWDDFFNHPWFHSKKGVDKLIDSLSELDNKQSLSLSPVVRPDILPRKGSNLTKMSSFNNGNSQNNPPGRSQSSGIPLNNKRQSNSLSCSPYDRFRYSPKQPFNDSPINKGIIYTDTIQIENDYLDDIIRYEKNTQSSQSIIKLDPNINPLAKQKTYVQSAMSIISGFFG